MTSLVHGIIPPPDAGRRSRPGSRSDPTSGPATGGGIITEHRGTITVDSHPDHGTTVKIEIPL